MYLKHFLNLKKKQILYGTDLILFTYSYAIHQCIPTSTQAANIPIYPGLVRGDGKDNDCDGKVDEERLNGIGMFQRKANLKLLECKRFIFVYWIPKIQTECLNVKTILTLHKSDRFVFF